MLQEVAGYLPSVEGRVVHIIWRSTAGAYYMMQRATENQNGVLVTPRSLNVVFHRTRLGAW